MKSAYVAAKLRTGGDHSKAYFNQKEFEAPQLRDVPAGSLNASVIDLAQFTKMTFNNGRYNDKQIVKPETLLEMQRFQDGNATFDVNKSIGLGWLIDNRFGDEAGVTAFHSGGIPMFYSNLLTLPKHKLAVVVFAKNNTALGITGEIAHEVMKLALESETGIKTHKTVAPTEVLDTLEEDLQRLPGYWSSTYDVAQIQRHDKQLTVKMKDETFNLVRREDGLYYFQYRFLNTRYLSR